MTDKNIRPKITNVVYYQIYQIYHYQISHTTLSSLRGTSLPTFPYSNHGEVNIEM